MHSTVAQAIICMVQCDNVFERANERADTRLPADRCCGTTTNSGSSSSSSIGGSCRCSSVRLTVVVVAVVVCDGNKNVMSLKYCSRQYGIIDDVGANVVKRCNEDVNNIHIYGEVHVSWKDCVVWMCFGTLYGIYAGKWQNKMIRTVIQRE